MSRTTIELPTTDPEASSALSTSPAIEVWTKDGHRSWHLVRYTVDDFAIWNPSDVCVIFLSSEMIKSKELQQLVSEKFTVPSLFWSPVAQKASGFFGCQDGRIENSGNGGYSTWFRFLVKQPHYDPTRRGGGNPSYTWHKLAFATKWVPSRSNVLICFDIAQEMKACIQQSLSSNIFNLHEPYSIHPLIVKETVAQFDISVWALRDLVRVTELARNHSNIQAPDYQRLHELARHLIHSSETLFVALETLSSMSHSHEAYLVQASLATDAIKLESRNIKHALQFQVSLLQCLKSRSTALEDRLRNEINLSFNVVAQHDSAIAVRIGRAAQDDSAAMKTIAMLTLAFLPGTFVSAIFSMSFFSFSPASQTEPAQWSISADFWIYWAVAIPTTAITLGLWVGWHRQH